MKKKPHKILKTLDLFSPPVGCTQGDKTYEHMENVTTSDPCDLCQCDNGNIVCAKRVCPNLLPGSIPEGCREVRAEGECCPTFECAQVEEQVQETTARPAEESVGQTLSTSREPKPLEGGVTVPIMGLQTTTPPAASEEEESSTQTVEAATQSENVGETFFSWPIESAL